MKFTLNYDGELRANSRPNLKWEIRKHFSHQLSELWELNPSLRELARSPWAPLSYGYFTPEVHHSIPSMERAATRPPHGEWVHLCEPVRRDRRSFLPLVRESLALRCGLKVLFLRKEESGRVYQGGDMDNRLKTLLDSLSVPNPDQMVEDSDAPELIHCLLEDDSLITGLSVETDRLLNMPNTTKHQVRLIIEVDVRVAEPRGYNQRFLGG